LYLDHVNNLFSLIRIFLTKQKVNNTCHHRYYSLAIAGGLQVTEGGTCDASESKVMHNGV
jgi:hypothetical protein